MSGCVLLKTSGITSVFSPDFGPGIIDPRPPRVIPTGGAGTSGGGTWEPIPKPPKWPPPPFPNPGTSPSPNPGGSPPDSGGGDGGNICTVRIPEGQSGVAVPAGCTSVILVVD